ncbi:MAG: VWA domain-containing protein [Oscillospiraceae bacterium]|nr:VWA domain-containing protein [Oscillospiraceae bacterium]
MKRRVILFSLVAALTLSVGCSAIRSESPEMMESPPATSAPDEAYPYAYAPAAPDNYYDSAMEMSEQWRYAPLDETEEYLTAAESAFKDVKTSPLSTFSADVDTASYSNMRRFLTQRVSPQGTRIEELVNYFDYDYPAPAPGSDYPFSISAEINTCPWEPSHLLAMIGIQGKQLQNTADIANNIVFLLDVSGSMNESNKLPLVRESMKLMFENLGKNDIISIVTYAGSDKIVADSIRGSERTRLIRLIDSLRAGGSTAGAQGIRSAYELAGKNYIEGGNNRIILATDGDFNVGESSVDSLVRLIEGNRDRGIFISVLGFGMDNLKDDMMKSIASNGNGNYAYIDTLQEAKKVLVDEFDSTMFTIAKDVKLQIEFNPEMVSSYRLIGYDTRRLENEDFNNDLKDAGDIGSGHNVTAFYELIPVDVEKDELVDPLKYSQNVTTGSADFFTVKIRYKEPDGDVSMLTELVVDSKVIGKSESTNFMFASAVAEFGLIITNSDYKAAASLSSVTSRARSGQGDDVYALRKEFLDLVKIYKEITA